jgi:hypothetical protein
MLLNPDISSAVTTKVAHLMCGCRHSLKSQTPEEPLVSASQLVSSPVGQTYEHGALLRAGLPLLSSGNVHRSVAGRPSLPRSL